MGKQSIQKNRPRQAISRTETLRLFISHKTDDAGAAKEIADKLRSIGDGALGVFLSEELPLGVEWLPTLHKQLEKADRLLLLYTDPDQQWDWCLYESGFFKGRQAANGSRNLNVFHDEEVAPPGPLQHFQNAPVSENHRDGVRRFLEELRKRARPLGPAAHGRRLDLGAETR
jgi:hypothetical protein